MADQTFFDTNVLLYADEPRNPKGQVARSLIATAFHDGSGVVSTQLLQE